MGNKTTTLEFTGILIPFLLCPDIMINQHIVIQVDNIACHYAWERGYAREDNTASVLVRILLLLCARLACVVHVVQGVLLGQQSGRQAFQSKVYFQARQSFAGQLQSASSACIFQKMDENPDRRLGSASSCSV